MQEMTLIDAASTVALVVFSLLCLVPSTSCYGNADASKPWELQWRRSTVSPTDLEVKKAYVKDKRLPAMLNNRLKAFETAERPWKYEPLDVASKKGATPLCKLFIVRSPNKPDSPDGWKARAKECSCAFVGPKLVITAAHCFTSPDEVLPDKGWTVYVIQGYGHKRLEKSITLTMDDVNMGVEWWVNLFYPTQPGRETKSNFDRAPYDIAFIHTEKESRGGAEYMLKKTTKAFNHETMFLGYPVDYLDCEVAVSLKGFTGGDLFSGAISHVTADTKDGKPGQMQNGGSGGPMVLAGDVRDGDDMFSVVSWGPDESRAEGQLKDVTFGPVFTDKFLKAARKIEKFPTTGTPATKQVEVFLEE